MTPGEVPEDVREPYRPFYVHRSDVQWHIARRFSDQELKMMGGSLARVEFRKEPMEWGNDWVVQFRADSKQELATLIHFIQVQLEHMWKKVLLEGTEDARDTDV